ncbi:MAG: CBS domain-containing protein [Deltaproteobacteria bacterium]|nr:CBS domain-containing protein [Deltaproteobacteria bacterium]
MKVRDVMTRNVTTVGEDDDLALALQILLWSGFRHLPVVRRGEVVGVLSEHDVVPRRQERDTVSVFRTEGLVRDAMASPAETIHPDAELEDAALRMVGRKVGCLPVVEGGSLAGIITMTDLATEVVRRSLPPIGAMTRTVEAVMTPDPVTCHADDRLLEAAARMVQFNVRHLPVIDADEHVIGVLSDRDIRQAIGNPLLPLTEVKPWRSELKSRSELRVADAMTRAPVIVHHDDSLERLINDLIDERVGAVPVVDHEERLVGIVSYLDVLASTGRLPDRGAIQTPHPAPAGM